MNGSSQRLRLDRLTDDRFGDLTDPANTRVSANTCARRAGASLPAGILITCRFSAYVGGDAGDRGSNVLTARASDDDGGAVERTASTSVAIVGEGSPVSPSPIGIAILALSAVVLLLIVQLALRREADEDGSDLWV
jgi:hypothetical protein